MGQCWAKLASHMANEVRDEEEEILSNGNVDGVGGDGAGEGSAGGGIGASSFCMTRSTRNRRSSHSPIVAKYS